MDLTDVQPKLLTCSGNSEITSSNSILLTLLGIPRPSEIRRSTSVCSSHILTIISATPGTKKNAYAAALPQNVTRLAGACRRDILSTTNVICDSRFWTNRFRVLWYTDSVMNCEAEETSEADEEFFLMNGRRSGERFDGLSARGA